MNVKEMAMKNEAPFGSEFLETVQPFEYGCGCGDAVRTSIVVSAPQEEYPGDPYGDGRK